MDNSGIVWILRVGADGRKIMLDSEGVSRKYRSNALKKT
jgi:hypothetical protein